MIDIFDYDYFENNISNLNINENQQPLLINLLINNKIYINSNNYSLFFETFKNQMSADIAYYIYNFILNNEIKYNNTFLLKRLITKDEYLKLILSNFNKLYIKLSQEEKNIVFCYLKINNKSFLIEKNFIKTDFNEFLLMEYEVEQYNPETLDIKHKSERAIGIELEFYSNKKIYDIASDNKLETLINIDDISENLNDKWILKEDGSIKCLDTQSQIEIVSPKIYNSQKEVHYLFLKNLLEKEKNNFMINESCGLHIHVDISDISNLDEEFQNLFKKEFLNYQELIYKKCAENRQDNPYCPKYIVDHKGFIHEKAYAHKVSQKRAGLNAFTAYKTVEFRMKESTNDYNEIIEWIDFCKNIVELIIAKMFNIEELIKYYEEKIK